MVDTPHKILIIVGIVFAFQFLLLQSGIGSQTQNFNETVSEPNNSSTFGFSDEPGTFGVLGAIWDVITTFIGFLTFNIPGAPDWIRFILSVTVNGPLAWAIAALIRGA